MKLYDENQILDAQFRAKVIQEIKGTENIRRKRIEIRKQEVYRDQTVKHVMDNLRKERLNPDTIQQMENRASNISICRKIINKKARSYNQGAIRVVGDADSQVTIEALERLLDVDQRMKKADRYSELHRNCLVGVLPEKDAWFSVDRDRFELSIKVLDPSMYDVIEDAVNPEKPKVIILSEFTEKGQRLPDPNQKGTPRWQTGDGIDQVIADSDEDSELIDQHFVWWSRNFHFTTNSKGEVIASKSPEDLLNPIMMLPFVNIAEDQDGQFWAVGGDDIIDGSILVNTILTDRNSIMYTQGWGQMVVTGKKIPRKIEGGPHTAILLEYDEGDPVPSVDFASSGAPYDAWDRAAEQTVALLLSTNDLSPGSIVGKLEPSQAVSGIADLISRSEYTGSVADKQNLFKDVERDLWRILATWQNSLYERDALTPPFMEAGVIRDMDLSIKFHDVTPVVSEEQKLNAIKLRKELGINTMIDLLQIDNPDLTDEEAGEKLKLILMEKMERQHQFLVGQMQPKVSDDQEAQSNEEDKEEDSLDGDR